MQMPFRLADDSKPTQTPWQQSTHGLKNTRRIPTIWPQSMGKCLAIAVNSTVHTWSSLVVLRGCRSFKGVCYGVLMEGEETSVTPWLVFQIVSSTYTLCIIMQMFIIVPCLLAICSGFFLYFLFRDGMELTCGVGSKTVVRRAFVGARTWDVEQIWSFFWR